MTIEIVMPAKTPSQILAKKIIECFGLAAYVTTIGIHFHSLDVSIDNTYADLFTLIKEDFDDAKKNDPTAKVYVENWKITVEIMADILAGKDIDEL